MKTPDNHIRTRSILATEIVEDLTDFLEMKGISRPMKASAHDPEAQDDIETFRIMVKHVEELLTKRVKEYENWRDC